jgi:hypothetical protein
VVDFAPKPELAARFGADFDAPVFGRGLALPKLGILCCSSINDEHGSTQPQI